MSRADLFNVRISPDLDEAIVAAHTKEGVTKSLWAREVLGAVALGGVTLEELRVLVSRKADVLSPHPVRHLSLQGQTGRKEAAVAVCSHPATAIKRLPFTDLCGLCGTTVRSR